MDNIVLKTGTIYAKMPNMTPKMTIFIDIMG